MIGAAARRAWLIVVIAVAVLVGVTVMTMPRDLGSPSGGRVDGAGRPVPASPGPAGEAASGRAAAVDELLRRRAQAVLGRDRTAFLAGIDPQADEAFRAAQEALFDNLDGVPLREWSYRVNAGQQTRPPEAPGDDTVPDDSWAPDVWLRYALTGADVVPTSRQMAYLFVRRGQSWYLSSDTALEPRGRRTWRGPWDHAPVVTTTTEKGLIIGHSGTRRLAERVARELDPAVDAVTEVWGPDWPRQVGVVLPEDTEELRSMVGPEFAVDNIAAVAVSDKVDIEKRQVEGPRVVLNPGTADRLSPSSLRVVLRHEVTHIAARAFTVDGAPMWMLEGFADFVGYRGSGIAPTQAAPELAAEVRSGAVIDLPTDTEFHSGDQRIDLAYQRSWSVVSFLAERLGEAKLVELYKRVAGVGHPTDAEVDRALREVTGMDRAILLTEWRGYLTQTFA